MKQGTIDIRGIWSKHLEFPCSLFSKATEYLQNNKTVLFRQTLLLLQTKLLKAKTLMAGGAGLGWHRDPSVAEAHTLYSLCLKVPHVLPLPISNFQPYMPSSMNPGSNQG